MTITMQYSNTKYEIFYRYSGNNPFGISPQS